MAPAVTWCSRCGARTRLHWTGRPERVRQGWRPRNANRRSWSLAPSGASIAGPNTCGLRAASPNASAARRTRSTSSGSHLLVEAHGAREVPPVHDEIDAQEPVDRGLEGLTPEEAVELDRRARRVVEVRLHCGAGAVPRAERIVVDRRDVADLLADEAEEHPLGADDVPDEVADDVQVVDDLLAHVDRWSIQLERAVDTVEKALELYGPPVYVRKQIVHNLHVVRDLEARGAVFVDEETEVPVGQTVVFSARRRAPRRRRSGRPALRSPRRRRRRRVPRGRGRRAGCGRSACGRRPVVRTARAPSRPCRRRARPRRSSRGARRGAPF